MILVDIEMPKSCRDCPIVHDEIYCSITHKSVLDQSIDFMKERLPDCPLLCEVKFDIEKFIKKPSDVVRSCSADDNVSIVMSIIPKSYEDQCYTFVEINPKEKTALQ